MVKTRIVAVFLLACLTATGPLRAQIPAYREWEFVLEPILWGVDVGGSARFKHGTSVVEVDLGEIAEGMERGMHLRFLARGDLWDVRVDMIRLDMDGEMEDPSVEAGMEQILVEGVLAREISEAFDATLGVRYWTLDADIDPADPSALSMERDKTWTDLQAGVDWSPYVGENLSLVLRGDLAVLGSADFGWSAEIQALYRPEGRISLGFGYRILDVDFEDDKDQNQLKYDVNLRGPILGLAVRF